MLKRDCRSQFSFVKVRNLFDSYWGLVLIRSGILSESDMYSFVCPMAVCFDFNAAGLSLSCVCSKRSIEIVSSAIRR